LAHILALAILRTYPETKFAIGPEVSDGFYYELDLGDIKISENDLLEIEKKMNIY
jgi:threonyl-tRNA synthetase